MLRIRRARARNEQESPCGNGVQGLAPCVSVGEGRTIGRTANTYIPAVGTAHWPSFLPRTLDKYSLTSPSSQNAASTSFLEH